MPNSKLLQILSSQPVLGVSMDGVQVLRLDLVDGDAPGNKRFKLNGYLALARAQGIPRLLSFGGAWSNHLHALAAVGHAEGFETVGVVRGEESAKPSAMLCDAQRWGMALHYVPREAYRRRDEALFLSELADRFGPCVLIPEGGSGSEGARGCSALADLLPEPPPGGGQILLPVGTGTTLAGLAAALDPGWSVLGVSVLRGAYDLEGRVQALLEDLTTATPAPWAINHDGHCGGYARVSNALRDFMLAFEAVHGIPLDPVYTGKAMYALHQRCAQVSGEQPPTIVIHTGGLQGRRGYDWLTSGA